MAINLQQEIIPGKKRDVNLDVILQKITSSFASIGTQVLAESPVPAVVNTLYNQYTLTRTPITGSVALYDAGLRVDPSTYTVAGNKVTILTASISGPTLIDYRF